MLSSRIPAAAFGLGQRIFQAGSLRRSSVSHQSFRSTLPGGVGAARAATEQEELADTDMKILFVEMGVGYDQHG